MHLACPFCRKSGSSHLTTHCDVCTIDGQPVALQPSSMDAPALIVPDASPEELERSRRAFAADTKSGREGRSEEIEDIAILLGANGLPLRK